MVSSHSNVEKPSSRWKLLPLQAYTALHLCGLKTKLSNPHLHTTIFSGTSHLRLHSSTLYHKDVKNTQHLKLSLRLNVFSLKSLTSSHPGFILTMLNLG